jgi:hypothetical protein
MVAVLAYMSQVKAPTDEMPVCQGRTTLSELSCVPQRNRHRWISLHQRRINMAAADRILLVVIHIPDHHQHSAILRVLKRHSVFLDYDSDSDGDGDWRKEWDEMGLYDGVFIMSATPKEIVQDLYEPDLRAILSMGIRR